MRRFLCSLLAAILLLVVIANPAAATNTTVFVLSDVHFTGNSLPPFDKAAIQAMNTMPGMECPFGTVATPSAVLICGDLCDGGKLLGTADATYLQQWNAFDYYFSKSGVPDGSYNRLKYPTYATVGNHDMLSCYGSYGRDVVCITDKIRARYGNVFYSFNLDGVHYVALGRYPDSICCNWLAYDLASVGRTAPVVLFMHYSLSDKGIWWLDVEKSAFRRTITGYNVIAILHGHTHRSEHYAWNGYDVYNDGCAGKDHCQFGILQITDYSLSYSEYDVTHSNGNWTGGKWIWTHSKPLPSQWPNLPNPNQR